MMMVNHVVATKPIITYTKCVKCCHRPLLPVLNLGGKATYTNASNIGVSFKRDGTFVAEVRIAVNPSAIVKIAPPIIGVFDDCERFIGCA